MNASTIQCRCYELPATYFAFGATGEDTFVHEAVRTLFTCTFKDFDIEWANHQSAASKTRRGKRGLEEVRPDMSLSKNGYTILPLEVKSPMYDRRSMEICTMTLMNGVYHFHCNHQVYLPGARDG
ncbi:hypothetical protein BG011_005956 [Mortierella polycephala]|uniref:Uncharacterized protein n=1 Tax=Mortierella polycephala TaxID=41804 RepID=A0A9P6QFK8_9FUNG|nr:hypothetical protein BG011_005956 [Mortierella polycephala]